MAKVGDKIPSMTLSGTQGGQDLTVDLAASAGKYRVLVFYPFAFTPV